jgi:hypothetical protein
LRNEELVKEYAEKLKPLMPMAHKAYGAKNQKTPAHLASQEYTRLLKEFHSLDGSLLDLSQELGVAYSGVRRRVFTSDLETLGSTRPRSAGKRLPEEVEASIERVRVAKSLGTIKYHAQLADEYMNGFSLGAIAKGLGITNAAPLYYGVQRHNLRKAKYSS